MPITPSILRQSFVKSCQRTRHLHASGVDAWAFWDFLENSGIHYKFLSQWQKFDQGAHFTVTDVSMVSHTHPSFLELAYYIEQNRPFPGIHIYIAPLQIYLHSNYHYQVLSSKHPSNYWSTIPMCRQNISITVEIDPKGQISTTKSLN